MKHKIHVRDLRIGMYVTELDRPWLETDFLFQGFPIVSEAELSALAQTCEYVYIDPLKTVRPGDYRRLRSVSPHTARRSAPPTPEQRLDEALPHARRTYRQAHGQVERLLSSARLGRAVDGKAARRVVVELVDAILGHPQALALVSTLEDVGEHAVDHAVSVCILSLVLGRQIGLRRDRLCELGLGALLHDVGETRVPPAVLHKPARSLSDAEAALLHAHTSEGAELLRRSRDIPAPVPEVAHAHHERMNGSGYPRRLRGQDITLYARIVGLADFYDTLTGERGAQALTPTDALKSLYSWRGSLFDGPLVEGFIQCLGIYPVGSLVELNTGEVGVVIHAPPQYRLSPTLLLLTDAGKQPCQPPRILNLAAHRDGAAPRYFVTRVHPPDAFGIDLRRHVLRELPLQLPGRRQPA